VRDLLMLAGGTALVTATAALWLQGRRRSDRRLFAGLVAMAVTLSLFSVVAWAATAIARIAPLPLTWVFVGTLAVLFALRLYRELQAPPPSEPG
jgi:cobalamin biosynthesis protein CobD/CbiB